VTYIEHPTQFTTGNGERGPAHHHANHYLETRVEKEVSNDPDTIERSLAIASDTLDVIEQRKKKKEEVKYGANGQKTLTMMKKGELDSGFHDDSTAQKMETCI